MLISNRLLYCIWKRSLDHVSYGGLRPMYQSIVSSIGRYIDADISSQLINMSVESQLSSDRYIERCIGRCVDQGTLKDT